MKFRYKLQKNNGFNENTISSKIKSILEDWNYVVQSRGANFYKFSIYGIPRMTDYNNHKRYNHYFRTGSILVNNQSDYYELTWRFSNSYIIMYCLGILLGVQLLGFVYSYIWQAFFMGTFLSICFLGYILVSVKIWANRIIKIVIKENSK